MLNVDQGNIAKVLDAPAVALLWRVAQGRGSDVERFAAGEFPALIHLPGHVHYHTAPSGAKLTVSGTWSLERLMCFFKAGPGGILAAAGSARPEWLAAVGPDGVFPVAGPAVHWIVREPQAGCPFVPVERELFEADARFLPRAAAWFQRESGRSACDERDREGLLTAARIAELWQDTNSRGALPGLGAFELELRLRRMGTTAGDWFASRIGWLQSLIGLESVRAVNRVLAPWAAATFMPQPLRLGMLDCCFADAGSVALMLAASAAAESLAVAAQERARAPRELPVRGLKYSSSMSAVAVGDPAVHKLVRAFDGVPVLAPMPDSATGKWELILPLRVQRTHKPALFRQPSPLTMRRECSSLDSIIVTIGEQAGEPQIATYFISDGSSRAELEREGGAGLARALRTLVFAAR